MKKIFYEMLYVAHKIYEDKQNLSPRELADVTRKLNQLMGLLRYTEVEGFYTDVEKYADFFKAHENLKYFLINYYKYRDIAAMTLC